MAQNFRDVNKFRLVVAMFMSLFSSLMLSQTDDYWTTKAVISSILSTLITGVAFLQCPEHKSKTPVIKK